MSVTALSNGEAGSSCRISLNEVIAIINTITGGTNLQFVRGDGTLGDIDTGMILTVPTVDGTANGVTDANFNCGYTSSAIGDVVYLDSSATWQKCDKDTEASVAGQIAIALQVKASGNALNVLRQGLIYATAFPTLTVGGLCYIGDAGAITQTQPSGGAFIKVIGHAVHADKIYFSPSADYFTSS